MRGERHRGDGIQHRTTSEEGGFQMSNLNTRHGNAIRKNVSKEYIAWCNAKARCHSSTSSSFSYYGEMGIKVCKRWYDSFENFLIDMGKCPVGFSLERKDPNKNYMPSNCKWASHYDQMNNTRRNRFLTFNGKTLTMSQWEKETGIKQSTIKIRLSRGVSIAEALTKSAIEGRKSYTVKKLLPTP